MANVRFRRGSPRGTASARPETWPDYGRSRDSVRALSASASVAAPTRLRRLDLKSIAFPLYLLAGDSDHITTREQVFAAENLIGTPKGRIEKKLVPSGHIGVAFGRAAFEKGVGRRSDPQSDRSSRSVIADAVILPHLASF
jgi:hypothetical protein